MPSYVVLFVLLIVGRGGGGGGYNDRGGGYERGGYDRGAFSAIVHTLDDVISLISSRMAFSLQVAMIVGDTQIVGDTAGTVVEAVMTVEDTTEDTVEDIREAVGDTMMAMEEVVVEVRSVTSMHRITHCRIM